MQNTNFLLKVKVLIRKHAAVPLLLMVFAIFLSTGIYIYTAKDDAAFQVNHIEGDPSVLNHIQISGQLIDGYHKTSFQWQGSATAAQTAINEKVETPGLYRYFMGGMKKIDDLDFSVSGTPFNRDYIITLREMKNNRTIRYEVAEATVPTRVYSMNTVYTNPLEYGIALIGDDVYWTLVATKQYGGSNGIYKLAFKSTSSYSEKSPESSVIMTFPLKDEGADDSTGIDVLGLEAVGDKLVLLLVQNNELHIQAYNTYGKRLGEAVMPDFQLVGQNTEENKPRYFEGYEAFVHAEENQIILSFNNSPSTDKTFITIDLTQAADIVDITRLTAESKGIREDTNYGYGVRDAFYNEGTLYYLTSVREVEDDSVNYIDARLPKRLVIHAYQQKKLVYKGELLTDINDDRIKWKNFNQSNYSIDEREYRNFDKLLIRKAQPKA
ncbi:hypothetical protein [Paenibacillus sp. GXUN7292]|uniref:hypothetical protein n=1 Tax=Paenibacillus sp. GXUN7292 TaxID=3422499 RepID=UPI003D7DEAC3